jgi:hypothetical protein
VNGGQAIFKPVHVNTTAFHIQIGHAQAVEFADATAVNKAHPNQATVALGGATGFGLLQQAGNLGARQVFTVSVVFLHYFSSKKATAGNRPAIAAFHP